MKISSEPALIRLVDPPNEVGINVASRAERLLAEYLRLWGLRDPQVIATRCRAWVDQCVDRSLQTPEEPSRSDLFRTVMQHATRDVEQWIDHLSRQLGDDAAADTTSRRGLLAVELQTVIDEYPTAFLDYGALPPTLLERLRLAARPAVPGTCHSNMPRQPLGELSGPFRSRWWNEWLGFLYEAARRLISRPFVGQVE